MTKISLANLQEIFQQVEDYLYVLISRAKKIQCNSKSDSLTVHCIQEALMKTNTGSLSSFRCPIFSFPFAADNAILKLKEAVKTNINSSVTKISVDIHWLGVLRDKHRGKHSRKTLIIPELKQNSKQKKLSGTFNEAIFILLDFCSKK